MTTDPQLVLNLHHRPAMEREDFLVSPANAEAVGWVDRWPDWPGSSIVIVGPAGSGKSHLGHVWRKRSHATFFGPDTASAQAPENVFVDDVDSQNRDPVIFHLYNAVSRSGGYALLTTRTPPARWTGRLPDLTSRLAAVPTVHIRPPDEALISAMIVKMFADRQLDVETEVIDYMVARMERSFETARELVAELDQVSLAGRRRITVPLVRAVLDRYG